MEGGREEGRKEGGEGNRERVRNVKDEKGTDV